MAPAAPTPLVMDAETTDALKQMVANQPSRYAGKFCLFFCCFVDDVEEIKGLKGEGNSTILCCGVCPVQKLSREATYDELGQSTIKDSRGLVTTTTLTAFDAATKQATYTQQTDVPGHGTHDTGKVVVDYANGPTKTIFMRQRAPMVMRAA